MAASHEYYLLTIPIAAYLANSIQIKSYFNNSPKRLNQCKDLAKKQIFIGTMGFIILSRSSLQLFRTLNAAILGTSITTAIFLCASNLYNKER